MLVVALPACGRGEVAGRSAGHGGVRQVTENALPAPAIDAARGWYRAAGVDLDALGELPVDERARRLNQAVYAFCDQGNRSDPDLNALFEECVAACGGYSYVLRGLLEATGVRTRYVNLYNIPNQGNHTAVEVDLGDRWGFYDPTFGTYFTRDGTPDGPVLTLYEVTASYTAEELAGHVQQARDERAQFQSEPLAGLYSETFDHPYMSLENYQLSEARSRLDPRDLVILDIPLEMEDGRAGLGGFQATDVAAAQTAWLNETNAILLDDDRINDVSYISHELSNAQSERITTLSVAGVEPGQDYEISLLLFGAPGQEIQISPMGRSAFYGGRGRIQLQDERSVLTARFVAVEETARFALRNYNTAGMIRMLAVEIRRIP